jgi:hypothetical protein
LSLETWEALRMDIRHEPERLRFVAALEGAEAVLEYRPAGTGILEYFHTYVPNAFRGKGVAGRLVEFALEHALEEGLEVVPTCPFVARIIEREPRFRALRNDQGLD